MAEHVDFDDEPASAPAPLAVLPGRNGVPYSREAEEHLLSSVLLDGAPMLDRCREGGITTATFHDPKHQAVFAGLLDLHAHKKPVELAVLAEELKAGRQLEAIGGTAFLVEISRRIPTTAQASYFIQKCRELEILRDTIRAAQFTLEAAHNFQPGTGIEEFLETARASLPKGVGVTRLNPRGLGAFSVPVDGDSQCLLGDRYINRGDGAILSGSSGMGKSSLHLLLAVLWALSRDAFDIKPNGPLVSLVFQAEDSDGDIAEVWASIVYMLKLTEEEQKLVSERVIIVTDRVNRGARFFAEARRLVALHKPDILWINPLQAFLDGDITSAKDLGAFLREGLNAIDDRCAKFIIHHTTKPATGKDKTERLWHEVMYDMAGGAELINWARAIMSLRATEVEGQFKLVLAKRGRRAGVTVEVDQGAGVRHEPVTEIEIRHSSESIEVPGRKAKMRVIFWEKAPLTQTGEKIVGAKKTDPRYKFSDIRPIMAKFTRERPGSIPHISRAAAATMTISRPALNNLLNEAVSDGVLAKDERGFWMIT